MKCNGISGLNRTSDGWFDFKFNGTWKMCKVMGGFHIFRLVCKSAGDEALVPEMTSHNESKRNLFGNRIKRNPNTYVVNSINAVIRIIMMPRSNFSCFGLFHKHVIMKKTCFIGAHKLKCGCRNRSCSANVCKLLYSLPIDVIIKETSCGSSGGVLIGPGAR